MRSARRSFRSEPPRPGKPPRSERWARKPWSPIARSYQDLLLNLNPLVDLTHFYPSRLSTNEIEASSIIFS